MQPELLLIDGDSRESWPRVLYLFDVFGRALVCKIAVSCCVECVALSRCPQFFILLSPGLVGRDRVPVLVFDLVQLLIELLDPVIACQRMCVVLGHRDCGRVVVFAVESPACCLGCRVVC